MRALLFDSLIRVNPVRWQRVVEDPRMIRFYLKKVCLIIADGLTKGMCIAIYLFARSVVRMGKRSGWLHVALKQFSSSLQKAYGGVHEPPALLLTFLLSTPVSLSASSILA
ncbi:hypothetical protein SLEP1_g58585 [Rubroshorea leprosula]|uniref:Uncharacterized protein n=1 Tax=Rubroshorea leprosula TaxID=152421 RepID=A0AAV5MS79_9ROSI|nr:hypothetical protein SLEP1_g58585 [Rubroshorea leprosula]